MAGSGIGLALYTRVIDVYVVCAWTLIDTIIIIPKFAGALCTVIA